jgi:hypothetical protein
MGSSQVEQYCLKLESFHQASLELLDGFPQPLEDRVWIDRAAPRRAPDAQAFGETRDDAHDDLHRGALALPERPGRLRDIAVAGDPLQLAPGLPTGLPIGADIPPCALAVIGAIGL